MITVATKQTHIPSPTTKSFIDGRTRITLSPTFCLASVDEGPNLKLVVSEYVRIKAEWEKMNERRCAVRSRLDVVVTGLLINFVYSWIHTCYCAMLGV